MWMTLHDAARACGVSRRTLYNWRERGALKTRTTPGGRWLVWVDAELIESAGKSAPAPWKEREAAMKDLRKRLVALAGQLHASHLGSSELVGEAVLALDDLVEELAELYAWKARPSGHTKLSIMDSRSDRRARKA